MSSQVDGERIPLDSTPTNNKVALDLLTEIQPVLIEGAQFISEELREGWCSPVYQQRATYNRRVGERYKVWPKQVDQLFTKFVIASAGVIIRESDTSDELELLANDLVQARFKQDAQDPDLAFLTPRIAEAVATTRHAQELAEGITGKLHDIVTTDEEKDTLLRFLVAPVAMPGESPAASQDEREIQALKLFDTFTALEDEDSSVGTVAAKALENRELDIFIAEALFDAADYEDTLIDNQGRREAKNLLKLGSHLTGEDRETVIARLVTPEARVLWPEILTKLLHRELTDGTQAFAHNRTNYRNFLTAHRCIPPSATKGVDLTHLAEDILLETAKIRSTDTDTPMPKRIKAQTVVETMETRKRRRPPTEPTALDSELDTAQDTEGNEDQPKIYRELAYIKPDGSKAPEGSDECNKIFDDYAAKYHGTNGLAQDLEDIREWLKTMDMSGGKTRGIKPIGGGQSLKRGTAEFSKVYQLKPSEAVGLSLSSGLGSKIRVIFVMENNTIGILGIAQRDSMRAMTSKLGIRGRSRRK